MTGLLDAPALAYAAAALLALALGAFVYAFAFAPALPLPDVGVRGLKRRAALERSGAFAAVEPAMRFLAARIAALPLGASLRARIGTRLTHAGDYLGLSPDEFLALSLLSTAAFFGLGMLGRAVAPDVVGGPTVAAITALGALALALQVRAEIDRRFKQVNRGLPFAIDLASLAMSAGLDFPGALRQVTEKAPDKTDALHEELSRILHELELGYTRRRALEGLAERCPTEAVRDFAAAVVQSEEKGNPLAQVLETQAGMLRMRRSVAAEEAAARAGVLMVGPLMMIFACIILLVLGPFLVTNLTGDSLF